MIPTSTLAMRLHAAVWLMLAATGGLMPAPLKAQQSCGNYGTSVDFVDSPATAARRALREEKLVFVLHVSGNFETSAYT